MPKERINQLKVSEVISASKENSECTETREEVTDPEVWVSWNRPGDWGEGHVQLTTSCGVEYARNLVSAGWDEDILVSSGTLSRSEINRLISVLRRARDTAYGRDE